MTRFTERSFAACQRRCSDKKEVMETSICMFMFSKITALRGFHSARTVGFALLAASLLAVSGCSSGSTSSSVQVGAVLFTDANGVAQSQSTSPTSLIVSQGTYVSVNLKNDPQMLGVDWSVVCGSALPSGTPLPPGQTQDQSCGTFTPTHTMGGPIPGFVTSGVGYVAFYTAPAVPPAQGTVTLYASATSDHSKFSSVTLAIGGLPISVGFAPAPPPSMEPGASAQFKAVLNNDVTNAGVNWSVLCGSSACGSFSPVQTASGVVTTYTAPTTMPLGGTVQVRATSVVDSTKTATAIIQIVPISVSVSPQTLSVGTAGTGSLTATVLNDGVNKGVDWSVSCTNSTSPGNCGAITAHTASGAAAIYTAPTLANIAVGSMIAITATSTTDPAKSATATITTTQGNLVTGTGQAAQRTISGAQVTLYAAATSETALNTAANANNVSAVVTALTDQDGNFSIPYGYECPTADTQMFLVSTGGNAGGGTNPDLSLMTALGPCSGLDASRFVIDEATTAAAVYALTGFIVDPQHIGSSNVSPAAMTAAFSTAKDLVDTMTGLARTWTVSGKGMVPQAKINTLANLLSACAKTTGSSQGDGSVCDQIFHATNPGTTVATQAHNTIQALLDLARNATGFPGNPDSVPTLYQLATSSVSFGPAVSAESSDWTLAIQFPNGRESSGAVSSKALPADNTNPSVDSAGNVWVHGSGEAVTEFVGAASCAGAPKALVPIVASFRSAP